MNKIASKITKMNITATMIIAVIFSAFTSTLITKASEMLAKLPSLLGDSVALKNGLNATIGLYCLIAVSRSCLIAFRKTTFNKVYNDNITRLMKKEFTTRMENITDNHSGAMASNIDKFAGLTANLVLYALSLLEVAVMLGNLLIKMGAKVGIHAPLLCIVTMGIQAAACHAVFKKVNATEMHRKNALLRSVRQDVLQNIRTLRFLNKRDFAIGRVTDIQDDAIATSVAVVTKRTTITNLISSFSTVPLLLCVWLLRDSMDVELATFILLSEWIIDNGIGTILNIVDTVSERSDIKKALECLNDEDKTVYRGINKGISLKNIVFGYKDNDILFKVKNVLLKKGERYVLTGESGQGKSSLASLLVGILKPIEGYVPRHKAFYIHQETECLDMSIRDNIVMGANVTDDELMSLIDKIGLSDWISSLDNGLDTIIGEKGTKVSSGQKQRINIMRAVIEMKNIDDDTLIILDEPTSNLDDETEKLAINVIDEACKGTLLVITHRPAIAEICNHTLVVTNHEFTEV